MRQAPREQALSNDSQGQAANRARTIYPRPHSQKKQLDNDLLRKIVGCM